MDLELATIADIINELRTRGTRFVFVGAEKTADGQEQIHRVVHGANPEDVLHLVLAVRHELKRRADDQQVADQLQDDESAHDDVDH